MLYPINFKGQNIAQNSALAGSPDGPYGCRCGQSERLERSTEGAQAENADTKAKERESTSALLKPAVVGASAVGVLAALTLLSKGKAGVNFLNKEHLSKVRDFNMFKPSTYSNLFKEMKYGVLDIAAIALGSVAGGLSAGLLLDKKENKKAKLQESVSQMVGNIIFPLGLIFGVDSLVEKALAKGRVASKLSKPVKFGSGIAALIVGIMGGNKAANMINSKMLDKSDSREIKPQDLACHIDDGCVLAGLIGKGNKTCEMIARAIPLALVIPGAAVGLAKEGQDKKHG